MENHDNISGKEDGFMGGPTLWVNYQVMIVKMAKGKSFSHTPHIFIHTKRDKY